MPPAGPEELLDNPELSEAAAEAEFPFRYRQTSRSGLSYEVQEGENTFQFDLEREGSTAPPPP